MRVSPLTDVRVRETRSQAGPCAAILIGFEASRHSKSSAAAFDGCSGATQREMLRLMPVVRFTDRTVRFVRSSLYTTVVCKAANQLFGGCQRQATAEQVVKPWNQEQRPLLPLPPPLQLPALLGRPAGEGFGSEPMMQTVFWCRLGLLVGMLTGALPLGRDYARPDEQMKAFVAQWSERQTFNLNVASSSLAEGVFRNVQPLEF